MSSQILIVEDDTSLLEVLQKNLSDDGLQVEGTNDSLKALDMIEKQRYDVLITNIRMPLFSGLDLIRSANEAQPGLPVIILSGEGTLSEAIEAVNLNVFRFIKLPLKDVNTLKVAINQAIERSNLNKPALSKEIESELAYYRKCIVELYSLPRFGLIATGIAHNINSPLGGVIGYAQLAMMKNPNIKGLDMINQQAVKISQMLAGISEKGQSELTWNSADIDLNAMINKELEYLDFNLFFKHQIDKNLRLQKIPLMRGIYRDWSHILHHLIQNAIDAMYETSDRTLTISTVGENENIILSVKDTGEGISSEDIDKIFNPGYSTKQFPWEAEDNDEPAGFGLGLYIIKKLLKKYNAKIEVKSEPGTGTELTITTPINVYKKKYRKKSGK